MRVIALLALAAIVAPLAAAADCPAIPSLNPFAASACGGFRACDMKLCACLGVVNGTSAPQCIAATKSDVGCTKALSCGAEYFKCLTALDGARLNMSDPCADFGTTMHTAILQSASSNFTNSSLQTSCNANYCRLLNQSSWMSSCANPGQTVCTSALIPGASNITLAPNVTVTPVVYDIVATLRLSGANWSAVLSDPVKLAALKSGLTKDIAALLGVPATFIVILDLTIGSLVVSFAVIQGSGKSVAQLSTSVSAATASTSWLTTVSAVYAQVGTDSVSVTSAGVTQTAAPTTLSPGSTTSPAPGSVGAASFTSVAVAVAAAVAALML